MRSTARWIQGLRVLGGMGAAGGSASLLAAGAGRSRRPRWVLRPLPESPGQSLPGILRQDFADLASLIHPALALPVGIVRDEALARAFLLRPYVEGSDLLHALRGRRPMELVPWMASAAEALAILHRFGFLHRNLKPANILVPRKSLLGGASRGPRVVLCDPAWARGEGEAAFAADLLDLGKVFYRLLAGRAPAAGAGGFPVPPSDLRPDVPLDLERPVMRLLSPDPRRRYQSAALLLDDLVRLRRDRARPPLAPPECFLGRKEELRRALTGLGTPGRPAVVAVTGEAGHGKTTFLRRLSLEAQLRGYRTVSARAFSGSAAPLAPIGALLAPLIARASGSRALRQRYEKLLGARSSPAPAAPADDGERRRFLRGVIELLIAAGGLQPTLLLLDEVHLADPLTIELLAAFLRETRDSAQVLPEETRALSLVFSFRSERPFRGAVRPLLEALAAAGDGRIAVELPPLPGETVEEWLRLSLSWLPDEEIEKLAARLGGHPLLIREAIRRGGEVPAVRLDPVASLGGDERAVLAALAVLGRPAPRDLVAAASGLSSPRTRVALEGLLGNGLLSDDGGLLYFRHGSFQTWLLGTLERGERQALHRRIARRLSERGEDLVEEVAHHWLHSGSEREGVRPMLEAARRLARSHEVRRALALYRAALGRLPPGGARKRRAVAEETAEACARAGEYRAGIEVLKGLLAGERRRGESGRLQGRLGILFHRAGDPAQAASHLEKGLSLLAGARDPRWFRERLLAESELAEIRSNASDYARAEATCRRALEEIEASPAARGDRAVLRSEMVLLETLAHLRLKRFRFGEARELYEQSLRAGERLGAVPEKSLILNNLGILHIQEDRYAEAIGCYARARKLSAARGDDQSLAAIESNLAVLHAKCGEPDAADEAIRRAVRHDALCDSRRTRFLRLHSAGIVDLLLGRYGSAIESLRAAVEIAEELKDVHTRAFDLVYLGECHLARGEARAARAAFERALALGPPVPAPVEPMVLARRALLLAGRGEERAAREALLEAERRPGAEVPYLRAWNSLYLGWARRLLGERERAAESLEEARAFFDRVRVPAGEILASLELAAVEADEGLSARAAKRIESLRARAACGQGALRSPMLSARLLAYHTRVILEGPEPDLEEAASLLVEAESYLIGRKLQDLEALTRQLRRKLRDLSLERRAGPAVLPAPASDPGEGLEELDLLRGAASDLVGRFEEEIGEEKAEGLRRQLADFEARVQGARRALEGRRAPASPPARAESIIGRSPAARKLVALCLQAAPTGLSVLITGETGAGKELAARVIHGESPRRAGPFISLSTAALPAELLEAELFGYVRGAFSGAERDHSGLLAAARGGTFLFDEMGETPLPLQAKLLGVLERGRARPLGGVEEGGIDARYLFTTSRDPRALIREGKLREDLFFRMGGLEVAVPPLRERIEDLPDLVEHFRAQAAVGLDEEVRFDEGALRALAAYPWPGNVRELANTVTRMVLTRGGRIGAEEVRRFLDRAPADGVFPRELLASRPLPELHARLEREYLLKLHGELGGDLAAMAARLGIKLRALYDRLRRAGIRPREV